jgi:hypothetical protein
MRRLRHHRRSLLALPAVLAVLLGAAACSSSKDEAKQTTDSIDQSAGQTASSLDDASRKALEQMGSELSKLGEAAKQQVQDGSKDIRESAISTAVSAAAPGEFKRRGVDTDGIPACKATSPSIGTYHVDCTGKTRAGEDITLVGDDPGAPPSTFVGTVAGKEVFRQECIGVC